MTVNPDWRPHPNDHTPPLGRWEPTDDEIRAIMARDAEAAAREAATPCGGCGAKSDEQRCIGCMHDFGTSASAWVRRRGRVDLPDGIRPSGCSPEPDSPPSRLHGIVGAVWPDETMSARLDALHEWERDVWKIDPRHERPGWRDMEALTHAMLDNLERRLEAADGG